LALESRNIYEMRACKYLLDRIQNDSKEQVNTTNFTIEHILPQNEELDSEWKVMLGDEWKALREEWLHRLGNLALTGYNSEYGDRSFADKKTISGGFNGTVAITLFQELWQCRNVRMGHVQASPFSC
jgi:hypothetical protein